MVTYIKIRATDLNARRSRFHALGANRQRAALAEVALEQIEVAAVHAEIAVEVGAVIVAWVTLGLAEAVLHYIEVGGPYSVVVVRVGRPHRAHLRVGLRRAR